MPDDLVPDLVAQFRALLEGDVSARLTGIGTAHAEAVAAARDQVRLETEQAAAERIAALEASRDEAVDAARAEATRVADERIAALEATHADAIARARAEATAEAERLVGERTAAVEAAHAQAIAEARDHASAEAERRAGERLATLEASHAEALVSTRAQATADAERVASARAASFDAGQAEALAQAVAVAKADLERTWAARQAAERVEADERVRRALEQVPPGVDKTAETSTLLHAVRAMDDAPSLTAILHALTTAAASHATGAVLFVADGPRLRPLKAVGLTLPDAVPSSSPSLLGDAFRTGATASSLAGGAPAFAGVADADAAVAVPLTLEGSPVAALYAEGPASDAPAWVPGLELLARHASVCLTQMTIARTGRAVTFRSALSARAATAGHDAAGDDARRFARLLLSEIKLYHDADVREGRTQRDLLRRLAPEIARARQHYEERVPASVVGRDACFQHEMIQILAGGDAALLGGHA